MAKKKHKSRGKDGAIALKDIDMFFNTTLLYYCNVIFTVRVKGANKFGPDSVRIYYIDDSLTGDAARIDIDLSDMDNIDDPNVVSCKPVKGKTGLYKVKYRITGLSANTKYRFRVHLYPYYINKKNNLKRTSTHYQSPSEGPVVRKSKSDVLSRPIFEIANYLDVNNVEKIEWIDFTDCITVPSYDVNREDVTEEWEDANYDKHIIVPVQKIKGKFSMLFPSIERYNYFLYLINRSRELNTWSDACVQLYVQINNEIDQESYEAYNDFYWTRPARDIGYFVLKMGSNPWVRPIFGNFDKYSPIDVTIEEVADTD